jgi:hypothetical protein
MFICFDFLALCLKFEIEHCLANISKALDLFWQYGDPIISLIQLNWISTAKLRFCVEFKAATRAILQEDGKDPS